MSLPRERSFLRVFLQGPDSEAAAFGPPLRFQARACGVTRTGASAADRPPVRQAGELMR